MALIGPKTKRRSNAKTADVLLDDSITYMLEEPRRILMHDWITKGKKAIQDVIDEIKDRFEGGWGRGTPVKTGPACNTVGCIAGTCLFLKGKRPRYGEEEEQTLTLLTRKEVEHDFYLGLPTDPLQHELHKLFMGTTVDAPYGTKKYATIVAGRIRKFLKSHRAELKKVKV